jgi:hypothetical protein
MFYSIAANIGSPQILHRFINHYCRRFVLQYNTHCNHHEKQSKEEGLLSRHAQQELDAGGHDILHEHLDPAPG